MKPQRLAFALGIVIIVTASVTALWAYNRQVESEAEALKLRITNFSVDYPSVLTWGPVNWHFNVTFGNYGTQDASNVTLYITMVNNETNTSLWNYTTQFNTVAAGTQKNISESAQTDMTAWNAWAEKFNVENPKVIVFYNATLTVDNRLLAQKIIS